MQNFNSKMLNDFVRGECPEEQAKKIRQWLIRNRETGPFNEVLYALWNETPEITNGSRSQAAFEEFCQNLNPLDLPAANAHSNKNRLRMVFTRLQRIAAVLLIPALMAGYYFYTQSGKPKSWVEVFVAYGQKKEIVLPDQSSVWLNAGSKIIYPEKFNNRMRQVFVSGEAYIDVAHNASKPFYLSVGNINIRVLGTKFNVKSYPEESKTEISLVEGSIALEVSHNGLLKHYQMTPGTCMTFNHYIGETEVFRFSVASYTSWSEGNGLYFRNLPLEEIVHSLERRFDIQIVIRSESLKHEKYFASFVNNESLPEILDALNINNEMRYVRQGNVVDIYAVTN